jgi:hypothetical protein
MIRHECAESIEQSSIKRTSITSAISKIKTENIFMHMKNTAVFTGLMAASLFSIQVSAATMSHSYYMDHSNTLTDGQNYLKVTLAESTTTTGALDVTVETLDALKNAAGVNFGIQSFAFNAHPALLVSENANGFIIATQAMSLTNLADGWSLDTHKNMSEFGKFDIRLSGTGSTRMDPLTFTLGGVSFDTVDTYFAAHVADFSINGASSAFFAGGTHANGSGPDVGEIPLPAAAWLLGSGLIGMVGMARRRTAVAS